MKTIEDIKELLEERTGMDCSRLSQGCVEEALVKLTPENNDTLSPDPYSHPVQDEDFIQSLIDEVVIPESWFFRDENAFFCLREKVIEKKRTTPDSSLRILSVPCARGEEPFSIAMTLLEAGFTSNDFQIDAVDISRALIQSIDHYAYRSFSFRNELGHDMKKYFSEIQETFQIRPEVRSCVSFQQGNPIHIDFLAGRATYDIIFCRNLMIYLTDAARSNLMEHIFRLLKGDGFLFVGHAEVAPWIATRFQAVPHPGSFAVQRTNDTEKLKTDHREIRTGKHRKNALSKAPVNVKEGSRHNDDSEPQTLQQIRSLADRGDLDSAETLCLKRLQTCGSEWELLYMLGLVYLGKNKDREAERSFKKAIYLNPVHTESMAHLALLAEEQNNSEKASDWRKRLGTINNTRSA
ncbi:MAG TPA: hypothetical protein EYG38_13465 [Verrucomicrobia bacterium]|nr:hypothetical protein [Verrucomicrobiota bacterium]